MRRKAGFTLVEVVVALALAGLLATGAATAISQLVKSTDTVEATMLAVHNLDIAGRWVNLDGRMAQTTDLVNGAPPVTTMTLYRTDVYDGEPVDHTTSYSLVGDELRRNYDGQVTVVARGISAVGFSFDGQNIIATLTSADEERAYWMYLRNW